MELKKNISKLQYAFQNKNKPESIKQAIELFRNSSVVQECYAIASEYSAKACRNLNRLPDIASRQALVKLAGYVTSRKR